MDSLLDDVDLAPEMIKVLANALKSSRTRIRKLEAQLLEQVCTVQCSHHH